MNTSCLPERPRQQCRRSSLIRIFPVCHSDKHFVTPSPETNILFENRKRKKFKILEHLPYTSLQIHQITCRALTKILKTGVPENSLPKSGSPTIQQNIASFKKLDSQHQKWEFRTANQQLVRALTCIHKKDLFICFDTKIG